jgi:hypothetical protein
MALTQVTGPYPIFTDLDGTPLDDGYLYIGEINQDPEQNPIQVFWDANLTIPATQPIRTSNGYAYRNGTPALLYTGGEFSITIRNKREEFVLYSPVGYGFDPAAVSASVVKNDFVGNGVQVAFVLSASPSTILATNIFINGVYQEKDSYTLSGNTITFSIAPPLSSSIEIMTNETGIINSGNANDISYTLTAAGATLQTVQTKLEQYVSVKDFGAVGDGVTDDTVAIQAAVNNGVAAVYVPATTTYYKITDDITVPNGVTVYGDGWDSLIQQVTLNKDVFIAGNSNTFRALRLKVADGNDTDFVNCVYASAVNNLSVLDCFLELGDLGGVGVHIRNVQNSVVRGNRIYGGKYTSGAGPAASAADILLYSSGASERHIIDGNFCLSNNSQGIFIDALGYDGDILVSNNTCVTLDTTTCTETGTWALAATGGNRRHGIVIGYNSSTVSGPRTVVSGNVCRNTRWTGIYKQGVSSGPVIIANNICDLNGYDTANTLSGGIYFVQSGYEEVVGNYISRFQNTNVNTGGITVNATTAPVISASIRSNTVQGSLGKGLVLTTNSAFVEVADNTFLSNVGNDISVVPNAGNANIAGHNIVRNRIVRTSGSAVTGIAIDMQASTRTLVVKGNRITGNDNTTVSDQNAGIRISSQTENARIIDNEIDNFYYGFYAAQYYTTGRSPNYIYERNTFRDCNTGFMISGTTGNHTIPLVDNRFINVTTQVSGAALGGATVGRIVTRLGDKFTWQTTAAPATGAWDVGDQSANSTPAVGQPKGWMCTVAGTPGTWVSTGNL